MKPNALEIATKKISHKNSLPFHALLQNLHFRPNIMLLFEVYVWFHLTTAHKHTDCVTQYANWLTILDCDNQISTHHYQFLFTTKWCRMNCEKNKCGRKPALCVCVRAWMLCTHCLIIDHMLLSEFQQHHQQQQQ